MLGEPMPVRAPSIMNCLACSTWSCHSKMRMPASVSSRYRDSPIHFSGATSLTPGTTQRTSTPRRAASLSAFRVEGGGGV